MIATSNVQHGKRMYSINNFSVHYKVHNKRKKRSNRISARRIKELRADGLLPSFLEALKGADGYLTDENFLAVWPYVTMEEMNAVNGTFIPIESDIVWNRLGISTL